MGKRGNASGRLRLLLGGASVQNKSYSPFQVRPLECNHLTPGERGRSWQNGAGGERVPGLSAVTPGSRSVLACGSFVFSLVAAEWVGWWSLNLHVCLGP